MKKKNSKIAKAICAVLFVSMFANGCGSGGSANEAPAAPSEAPSASYAQPASKAPELVSGTVSEATSNNGQSSIKLNDAKYYSKESEPKSVNNSGEKYLELEENRATQTRDESMMTFSLKVDTAAYNNVERFISNGSKPPAEAVKIEEMINYFNYDRLMLFDNDYPFSIYTEIGKSVLDNDKYMAFVRVKSKDIDKEELPDSSLTFLIDTSGSMDSYDKLPLLKQAFNLLTETLGENDRVSIVTYAGSAGVVLNGASGEDKKVIMNALNNLNAGGSTAGGQGIMLAYAVAEENFIKNGNNRIILATDGDFNVGISSTGELEGLISEKRESGIYLSILGFGTGNIRDDIMETLSKNGNGNYAYINNLTTANKVLVEELSSNIFTVANDVKAQIEFNPENVADYRLVGYENRRLNNEDFNDDTVDAGEIGVGTDVVLMFEFTLKGENTTGQKYGSATKEASDSEFANELFEVRIRYKNPGENESRLITYPVEFEQINENNSTDFNFASSVAAFGHILRDSQYVQDSSLNDVVNLAIDSLGNDNGGYRKDFINMVNNYIGFAK